MTCEELAIDRRIEWLELQAYDATMDIEELLTAFDDQVRPLSSFEEAVEY